MPRSVQEFPTTLLSSYSGFTLRDALAVRRQDGTVQERPRATIQTMMQHLLAEANNGLAGHNDVNTRRQEPNPQGRQASEDQEAIQALSDILAEALETANSFAVMPTNFEGNLDGNEVANRQGQRSIG